jgi:hypothetical protein
MIAFAVVIEVERGKSAISYSAFLYADDFAPIAE